MEGFCFAKLLLGGGGGGGHSVCYLGAGNPDSGGTHGEALPPAIPTLRNPLLFSRGQKYRMCF